MEKLQMQVTYLTLSDLAELEPAENITDITLFWVEGPSLEECLPVLKRWRHLRRLTLRNYLKKLVPPFEVLSDFIMEMEHLSHLHVTPRYDRSNYGQLEILRDKVNELISPQRPNFKFDIFFRFL